MGILRPRPEPPKCSMCQGPTKVTKVRTNAGKFVVATFCLICDGASGAKP